MAEDQTLIGARSRISRVCVYAVLSVVAVAALAPIVATVLGGFKSLGDLRVNPAGLPREWVWANYLSILGSGTYWRMMLNSFLIAAWSVVFTVVFASMVAFAFAQFQFRGKKALMSYITLGLMFPTATAVVPLFVILTQFGLVDSHLGVILPKVAGGMTMAQPLSASATDAAVRVRKCRGFMGRGVGRMQGNRWLAHGGAVLRRPRAPVRRTPGGPDTHRSSAAC